LRQEQAAIDEAHRRARADQPGFGVERCRNATKNAQVGGVRAVRRVRTPKRGREGADLQECCGSAGTAQVRLHDIYGVAPQEASKVLG